LFNRGNTLQELKRFDEAVASYAHLGLKRTSALRDEGALRLITALTLNE
jgi:uncharacterized Rmd1/YagE family protein